MMKIVKIQKLSKVGLKEEKNNILFLLNWNIILD